MKEMMFIVIFISGFGFVAFQKDEKSSRDIYKLSGAAVRKTRSLQLHFFFMNH